jgi:transcription elongation factor Elf1
MKPAYGEVDVYSQFMDLWYSGKAPITTQPPAEPKPGQT